MNLRYAATSPYVRKVMAVAMETGQAKKIEKIPSAVSPTKANEELTRENPLGKVPSLTTDEGLVLFDSPVICEYLDSLHKGPRLHPPVGPARWTALRQQALADGLLDAALLIRYEMTRPAEFQWAEWTEGQRAKVLASLDALEGEVEKLKGALTIGHISVGCALGYLDLRFSSEGWRNGHPKLAAWYREFATRPSMLETMPPL